MVRPHLLVAVMADGNAAALVDLARQVCAGAGGTWSVVGMDTPATERLGSEHRALLLEALDRAERLGATVSRISTGTLTPTGVVSSLVHRARSEGATAVMIGRPHDGARVWLGQGRDLSEFAEVLSQLLPSASIHLVSLPVVRAASRADGLHPTMEPAVVGRLADWVGVAAVLLLCTLAGAALERWLHPANLVMVYLAGVVFVASRSGRAPAVATVLGSILLYDLIFVAPRWSLKPTEPQYWFAFLLMMVVGLIISQFAARSREQARVAESRAQRTQALNDLAVALGRARDGAAVSQALCRAVRTCTGAQASVLPVDAGDAAPLAGSHPPAGFDEGLAQEALSSGLETGAGTPRSGDRPLRYVPIATGEQAFGVLVIPASQIRRDTLEDRHLVRALATQAAVAMERAAFELKSAAAAIETEVERTRNTLLAGISHDFRTPLTTIVGSATTLIEQSRALDEDRREGLLRGLLGEARRLDLLTHNLLELTRLDAGAIPLRPEWCPADNLIAEALGPFGARVGSVELAMEVPPYAVVWCDPRLMGQAVVNLVDNALRHSPPEGRVTVAITAGAREWALSVHDEGPGIAPGQEQAIFRKYYRFGHDGDASGKGLGLAICAAVARLHAGTIRVDSDRGARFVLSIPQPAWPPSALGELE